MWFQMTPKAMGSEVYKEALNKKAIITMYTEELYRHGSRTDFKGLGA
jgi:hypothetical protein